MTWAVISVILLTVVLVVYFDRTARGLAIDALEGLGLPSDFLYG